MALLRSWKEHLHPPARPISYLSIIGTCADGFTLIEALTVVFIMGLFMGMTTYLITHLLYNSRTTLKQSVVDEWGRLDYLLETDIREAMEITIDSNSFGSCGASVSSPKISLKTAYSSAPIVYYNKPVGSLSQIWRCGPAILSDGTLSSSINSDDLVAENAALTASLQQDVSLVQYTITFGALSTTETGFVRLRARSY
jgi:hypothetical protein